MAPMGGRRVEAGGTVLRSKGGARVMGLHRRRMKRGLAQVEEDEEALAVRKKRGGGASGDGFTQP